eukprot:3920028-Pleurochrysis_carterae.AAC.1
MPSTRNYAIHPKLSRPTETKPSTLNYAIHPKRLKKQSSTLECWLYYRLFIPINKSTPSTLNCDIHPKLSHPP